MTDEGEQITRVLDFWFGELGPAQWFASDKALDATIRDRFLDTYRHVAAAPPAEATTDPDAALATVIILDQFPRNMFRGTAEAFVGDDQAMRFARNAVDTGLDDGMAPDHKRFLYMPFMHSERLADQERGVDLFKRLGEEESVKYAIEHRDIIQRFGRFPHRNRVLGRQSTADERAFLLSHEGFGQ